MAVSSRTIAGPASGVVADRARWTTANGSHSPRVNDQASIDVLPPRRLRPPAPLAPRPAAERGADRRADGDDLDLLVDQVPERAVVVGA